MSLDTYTYFLIVLGGFMLVWSYRKFTHSQKHITDFEYLGFSTFWGTLLVTTIVELTKSASAQVTALFGNPFASGIVFSILGFLVGWVGAEFMLLCKAVRERSNKK